VTEGPGIVGLLDFLALRFSNLIKTIKKDPRVGSKVKRVNSQFKM
jgi:hypothetical protein